MTYLGKAWDPEKDRANGLVHRAVKTGKLTKPGKCQVCNIECVPHGHHDDYSKPLEVRWLCRKCHRQWHRDHTSITQLRPLTDVELWRRKRRKKAPKFAKSQKREKRAGAPYASAGKKDNKSTSL